MRCIKCGVENSTMECKRCGFNIETQQFALLGCEEMGGETFRNPLIVHLTGILLLFQAKEIESSFLEVADLQIKRMSQMDYSGGASMRSVQGIEEAVHSMTNHLIEAMGKVIRTDACSSDLRDALFRSAVQLNRYLQYIEDWEKITNQLLQQNSED